jgi:nitrite reductase/ring-hydroxylating ferredoxin subunit/uncharacterized membrane protein
MSDDPVLALIEKQEWLGPIQQKGAELVQSAFASAGESGQPIKNFLHGVWLGHPLHSVITDVPVGSWTAAAVLDLLELAGKGEYGPGADAAVAIGLGAAVGAAVTGLTDWSDTTGKPQRVGAMHALLNSTAALLYGASYIARKRDNRGSGRLLGFLGYGFVFAGAYLGGALSYRQRIGVDHSVDTDENLPNDWTRVASENELPEGQPHKTTLNCVDLFLLKRGGQIFALGNACSHLGGPLNEGKLEGDIIQCPWHGSRFCIRDGSIVDGPTTHPQPTLQVRVENGDVLVRKADL